VGSDALLSRAPEEDAEDAGLLDDDVISTAMRPRCPTVIVILQD
jgi:hypothetical protein